jgi:RNA polymerase sigma-70 factor (ECF subfamily)
MVMMADDEQVLRNYTADSDSQRTLENSEWISIVRMMADGLSAKQKLVFTLCQLEGLSSEEVQEITGLDARQVKSNLYVAKQAIRKRLIAMGYE